MLRFTLLLSMSIGAYVHAHWVQPLEPIIEPIICQGHPSTFAVIQPGNKLVTIVVYEQGRVLKTITKDYPVNNFQFSAGCARLMMDSKQGKESIPLYDE